MANYASCDMYIFGNDEELKQLYAAMLLLCKAEDNFALLFHHYGFSDAFLEDKDLYRTGVQDIELDMDCDTHNLYVMYSSAWTGRDSAFSKLLENNFDNLRCVTKCEEEGCEVFYHTDAENVFFSDYDYVVVSEIKGDGDQIYCSSESDVRDAVGRLVGMDFGDDNQAAFDYADAFNETHDEDYINIHHFIYEEED